MIAIRNCIWCCYKSNSFLDSYWITNFLKAFFLFYRFLVITVWWNMWIRNITYLDISTRSIIKMSKIMELCCFSLEKNNIYFRIFNFKYLFSRLTFSLILCLNTNRLCFSWHVGLVLLTVRTRKLWKECRLCTFFTTH